MQNQVDTANLQGVDQQAQMSCIAGNGVVEIGGLVGPSESRHVHCKRTTEGRHSVHQVSPIA